MSELLKKYESIDQSKLKEAFVKVLDRVKKLTNDFTTEDKKNNEIAEQVLDSVMQKNPDAIKIVKREPKAKPAPKKTHKATHTAKATHKATSAPVAKNSDNNIMTVAKQIQKAGESWKDAMERAKVVLKERKEKVVEKQKTELEKLYALVKTKKELQGFANSDIKRDAVREAKVKGARFVTKEGSTSNAYGTFPNKIGRKYWETRDRHADRLAPNYPKDMPLLASGGAVSDAPFSVEVFKTKLRFDNELTSSSKGDFSTFAKAKEFAIDMIDSGNYYAYINSKNGYLWGVDSKGVEQFANGGGIDGGMNNLTIQNVSFAKGGAFKGFKFNVGDKVMVNTDLDFLNKFYHYQIPPTFEMGYDFTKPVTIVSVMVNSSNKPFYGLRTAPNEDSPKGYMVNSDLPEVLLSPATSSNDDSDVKIKDWYMKTYPTDDLGEELNDEVTFEDLWNEDYKKYNIYQVMGVGDSVIRERLFEHLAEIKGVTYSHVYRKLFSSDGFYAKGGGIGTKHFVGDFNEQQLRKGEDKIAIEKAQKETGLTYIQSKMIKKSGKPFMQVYLISNEDYLNSNEFANGGSVNMDKHIWEGWTVGSFIEELEPQFNQIMSGGSWKKPFKTKEEVKAWCMDNQPYYKKNIPEVVNYFWAKAQSKNSYANGGDFAPSVSDGTQFMNGVYEKGGVFYKEGSNKYGLGNTEIFVQEENNMYCVYDNVYNDESENWEIKKLADFDTMDEAKEFAIEHSKKEYADGGMNNLTMQNVSFADGGSVSNERMYNFLKDDLAELEEAIKSGDFVEVNIFFSYWLGSSGHLKSLETKNNERMYNFLKEDLEKLEVAVENNDTEEVERFFSYWGQHLESLKMANGGSLPYMTDPNFGDFQNTGSFANGGSIGDLTEQEFLKKYFGVNVFTENPSQFFEIKKLSSSDDNKVDAFVKELKADGFTVKKRAYSDFTSVMGVKKKGSFELGGAFVTTDLAGHTGGTDGLGNQMPLSGVSGTYYTGLVGETGAMSSGELFENGGGIEKTSKVEDIKNGMYKAFQSFLEGKISDEKLISTLNKLLGKRRWFRYFKGDTGASDVRSVESALNSRVNRESVKEDMQIALDTKGLQIYNWEGDEIFEAGGAMMQNQQVINDASQSYVNYYLGEGAGQGIYKDGGSIPNNYEGRTAEDIWKNWTEAQRSHFLLDHSELLDKDRMENNLGYTRTVQKNKTFSELTPLTKRVLEAHIEKGQYAKGGALKDVDDNLYVSISKTQDDYWVVTSKPTTKEQAEKMARLVTPMRGEVNDVKTVGQVKAHSKVIYANGGGVGSSFNDSVADKMEKISTMKSFASKVRNIKTPITYKELNDLLPDYVSGKDINDVLKKNSYADGGFTPNVSDGTQFMSGVYANGGSVGDVSGNYYSTTDFVSQNDLMDLAKSTFGQDWESGGDYDYDTEEIKMLVKKLGGGYKIIYVDSEQREKFENAKSKYLPLLKNKSNDGDIFVIPNKKMSDGGFTPDVSDGTQFMSGVYANGGGIRSQEELNKIISEKDEKVKGLTPKQVAEMWNENSFGVKEGISKPITVEEAKNPTMKMYLRNLLIENELTEDEYSEYFAKGGTLKKYIDNEDINYVALMIKGSRRIVKGSDVLNGANLLKDGGDLSNIAFYVPKRDVISVTLKNGKTIKPVNGYWVKKDYQPINGSGSNNVDESFKIGDYVKKTEKQGSIVYGTQGFIYEINKDFSEIKLEDDYGNKNPKSYKLKGFRKLKSKSKNANVISNSPNSIVKKDSNKLVAPKGYVFVNSGSHRATQQINRGDTKYVSLYSFGGANTSAGTTIMFMTENDYEKIKGIRGVSPAKNSLPAKSEWFSRHEDKKLDTVFLQIKQEESFGFADGGAMQGNNIDAELEDFDLDNLDPFETMQYNQFVKSSGKVGALQILINTVEGDYSQLSPELAELAEMQVSQEQWDEASRDIRFERDGYADGGVMAKGGMLVYLDGEKSKSFKTKKALYEFVRSQTGTGVKKVEIDYGNRIYPTFDTYEIVDGKLIHKGEFFQKNYDKEEAEKRRLETERSLNQMMGYADGGGVSDYANSPQYKALRDKFDKLHFDVKSRVVIAVGLDSAIEFYDADLTIAPYRFIERAVTGNFISLNEINQRLIDSAMEEAEEIDNDDDLEEIGSSDFTYYLKNVLDGAGFKVGFVGSRLERLNEDGSIKQINNGFFEDGGFMNSVELEDGEIMNDAEFADGGFMNDVYAKGGSLNVMENRELKTFVNSLFNRAKNKIANDKGNSLFVLSATVIATKESLGNPSFYLGVKKVQNSRPTYVVGSGFLSSDMLVYESYKKDSRFLETESIVEAKKFLNDKVKKQILYLRNRSVLADGGMFYDNDGFMKADNNNNYRYPEREVHVDTIDEPIDLTSNVSNKTNKVVIQPLNEDIDLSDDNRVRARMTQSNRGSAENFSKINPRAFEFIEELPMPTSHLHKND